MPSGGSTAKATVIKAEAHDQKRKVFFSRSDAWFWKRN
jgi:hypothetical protein